MTQFYKLKGYNNQGLLCSHTDSLLGCANMLFSIATGGFNMDVKTISLFPVNSIDDDSPKTIELR